MCSDKAFHSSVAAMELLEKLNLLLETPGFSSSKLPDLPTHTNTWEMCWLWELKWREQPFCNGTERLKDSSEGEGLAEAVFSILKEISFSTKMLFEQQDHL